MISLEPENGTSFVNATRVRLEVLNAAHSNLKSFSLVFLALAMDVTVVLYSRKVVGLMATILLQAQLASASDEEGIPRSLFLWTTTIKKTMNNADQNH
jgi:hypothetical protein